MTRRGFQKTSLRGGVKRRRSNLRLLRPFGPRNDSSGFTLIEVLITMALVALISLAVFSLFDSGIRVLERVAPSLQEEDAAIFFEKFSRDLQNSFVYKPILFQGDKLGLLFPALIRTLPEMGGDQGVGRVSYFYDEASKSIQRRQENPSEIFEEKPPSPVILLENISSFQFQYYEWDPDERIYTWKEEWKEEGEEREGKRPFAVKVELILENQGRGRRLEKTFPIPVIGS